MGAGACRCSVGAADVCERAGYVQAMTLHRTVASAFRATHQTLAFAEQGAAQFLKRGTEAEFGLHTAVTNGRAVTFVLQNLTSNDLLGSPFLTWYDREMTQMRADPIDRWFVELRNRIEKQGTMGARTGTFISNYSSSTVEPDRPIGATSRFLGDHMGRAGWKIALPDGSTTVVYTATPPYMRTVMTTLGAPDDFDVFKHLEPWLAKLRDLVERAEAEWGMK